MSFAGPKRQARPGLDWKDLPPIDVVLVSHTHYDHLDRPTIKNLGKEPCYFIPTNMTQWFSALQISNTKELQWWESERVGDILITSVPANHWSKRKPWVKNDAGWGGYVIETPAGTVYFAADTGKHNSYFKEIGKKFPNIDLGLIPIGAYYPQWIFGRFHVNPHDAVEIHKQVGAKKSIGMHWGVFKLTEEPLQEPPEKLAEDAAKAGLPPEEFTVLKIGETIYYRNRNGS